MKKLLFSILFTVAVMFAAHSQSNFNAAVGADSSTAAYVKATVGGGAGNLTVQAIITKVANTGTTVAGYVILQGSLDDTNYVNVPTYKVVKDSATSYGRNIFQVDTFTLANTTSAQPYIWQVVTHDADIHPYYYYRFKVVMTTTTALCRGKYIFRRRI